MSRQLGSLMLKMTQYCQKLHYRVAMIFYATRSRCGRSIDKHIRREKNTDDHDSDVGCAGNTAHYNIHLTGRRIMQIKSSLAGAAIALVAGLGAASAADQFATLAGVEAQTMSSHAMGLVVGSHFLTITPPGSPTAVGVPDGMLLNRGMAGGPGLTLAGNKLGATGAAAAIN